MSKLVKYTFFKDRPKCGGMQVYPLNAGRLIILENKNNPLAGGEQEEEPGHEALWEALMVLTCDSKQLYELSNLDDDEWKAEVCIFGLEVEDDVLNDFQELIESEMDRVQKAMIKPKKKSAKRGRKRGKAK